MLSVTNITKTFNPASVNEKIAIRDISLHLSPGDFVTVIGGNGAGKSTLFGAICGSFLVDCGTIVLDGEDITLTKEYRRSRQIGRLFQDPQKGTAPTMTIEENLALAYMQSSGKGLRFGLSKQDRVFFKEQLAQLDLGLEDRLQTAVGLLSGGQRQALSLLMATVVTPKLLLLDEHTAALDPSTAHKVLEITKKIVKEHNLTCMMITHNITSALELGNRTIMMDDGGIILDITGEERADMTVPKLLELFKQKSNKVLDNDRMLLE